MGTILLSITGPDNHPVPLSIVPDPNNRLILTFSVKTFPLGDPLALQTNAYFAASRLIVLMPRQVARAFSIFSKRTLLNFESLCFVRASQ